MIHIELFVRAITSLVKVTRQPSLRSLKTLDSRCILVSNFKKDRVNSESRRIARHRFVASL